MAPALTLDRRSPGAKASSTQSFIKRREIHARRRLRDRPRQAARRLVTIAISDNGIGIPKDALRKLGRPFEQVESQLTKRHQGSGLGLAIAKSLAELHGGRMRIRSVLGVGTTVVVRLPLKAAQVASGSEGRLEHDPEKWTPVFGKIILINKLERDDEESHRALRPRSQKPHEALPRFDVPFLQGALAAPENPADPQRG